MIDGDYKEELNLIDLILSQNKSKIDLSYIIVDAIRDAINSSGDVDEAIKYIIITHPILLDQLKEFVETNYPDKLTELEKLAVLI